MYTHSEKRKLDQVKDLMTMLGFGDNNTSRPKEHRTTKRAGDSLESIVNMDKKAVEKLSKQEKEILTQKAMSAHKEGIRQLFGGGKLRGTG